MCIFIHKYVRIINTFIFSSTYLASSPAVNAPDFPIGYPRSVQVSQQYFHEQVSI